MLSIQENPLTYFDMAKRHFADMRNIRKISNVKFKIEEDEINNYLSEFKNGQPNVYALLIKKPNELLWNIKYIGQRESKGIKQRLREHLIKCNPQTGSQFEKVNLALLDGFEIGIKLLTILPDTYRLLYESMLINEFKEKLEWNRQK